MPTNPKYKVIPGWRDGLLKLVGRGHHIRAVCTRMKVGYDRVLMEKRRDPGFAEQLDAAEAAGKESPSRKGYFG